ncbi:MAG TPA: aromatic ring-hydroxylating dioxygenase subunit alpha [Candidatus Baltobacteraceae bacterium]
MAERPLDVSLPRAAYWDDAFFERERRAIFWDQWFYAGRADRLSEPGAFEVLDLAGESIIVIRDRDGRLYGHINLCRHRGSRLLCGEGVQRGAIRCPYHGWSYALDGTLVATPFVEDGDVPIEARKLHPVAVDTWGGFLFINCHPEPFDSASLRSGQAKSKSGHLLDQLGAVPERLARYPLADLVTVKSIVYEVDANWKVLLENYNECYHCAGVHPELCRVVPAFKRQGGAELDWERGIAHREGAWTFTFSGTTAREPFPGLDDDERVRHKGELIYPNFMLSLSAEHVAAFSLWPKSPSKTVVQCDFLFHPTEIAKPGFDPSDAIDFWDLVNRQDWWICACVQSGMSSQRFEYGYYAPMEDYSLDIRRYVRERLGDG